MCGTHKEPTNQVRSQNTWYFTLQTRRQITTKCREPWTTEPCWPPRFIDICKKVVVNHWFQRFTMVYHRFTNMYPYVSCILLCFDIAKFSRFSQRGSWPSWLRLGVPRHASQEEISQAWTYSQTSVGWGILMLGWLILPKRPNHDYFSDIGANWPFN
jgi:hypothetical protein